MVASRLAELAREKTALVTERAGMVPLSGVKGWSLDDINSRVEVNDMGKGTLVFIGEHAANGKAMLGIRLDAANGKNNGRIKGQQYFACKPKFGTLCIPKNVSKIAEDRLGVNEAEAAAAAERDLLNKEAGQIFDDFCEQAPDPAEIDRLPRATCLVETSFPTHTSEELFEGFGPADENGYVFFLFVLMCV